MSSATYSERFFAKGTPGYPWRQAQLVLHDYDGPLIEQPPFLRYTLTPHQITATSWMLAREVNPPGSFPMRGGILADEMGLGKTITVLGLLSLEKSHPQLFQMKFDCKYTQHTERTQDTFLIEKLSKFSQLLRKPERFRVLFLSLYLSFSAIYCPWPS